ncbi:O-methyltransferase [Pseudorhodoferax sp. Leaf267]|uniref:O-methyltransferase n=1 Tax=Pseudorhodoferax sp. Leaf267 TaxID=1736316 RepID=UPI0006F44A21|nr:methyltransferase domain-containing protein [Pseudorhodoferax sp. Leaf267]KQP18230.1 hypothetical protein ASF43_10395 [Pseudorhodoferax sp. Leaf267]
MTLPSHTRAPLPLDPDPHADLREATRRHRQAHGCGAYTFEDGAGLLRCVQGLQPRRILELGCALGYTACTLATAAPQAQVVTVDGDDAHVRLAREAIARRGLDARVQVRHARFDAVLREQPPASFDLVFFDGFAPDAALLQDIARVLAPRGHLVCSNTQLADDPRALRAAQALHFAELRDLALEGGRTRVLRLR